MRDLKSLPDMLFTVGAAFFIGWGVSTLNNTSTRGQFSSTSYEARLSADTIVCKSVPELNSYEAKAEQGLDHEVAALKTAGDCVVIKRGALREIEPMAEHIRLRAFGEESWWYAKASTPIHRNLELADYTLWDLLALALGLVGLRAGAKTVQAWVSARLTSSKSPR